jgi:GTP pyrophosphokinase
MVAEVAEAIRDADPESETVGRLKTPEGTSRKEKRFKTEVRAIHDKVGVRVIVHTFAQCFVAIELLHRKMTYIEYLYDDYVTYPKKNGYQSLHTTILAANGWPFEVQVRTQAMHANAERGAAAHDRYQEMMLQRTRAMHANAGRGPPAEEDYP